MKKLFLLFLVSVFFFSTVSWGQSYLGLDGGFEGSATIDNSNTQSVAQPNKWSKNNANLTIAEESATVRSGLYSIKINNSTTTGRRLFTPTFTTTSNSTLTIQFYRRSSAITSQTVAPNISKDGTVANDQTSTYKPVISINTWELVTYSPTSSISSGVTTFGGVLTKLVSSNEDYYIDDMCIYAGGVDNAAPNPPSVPISSQTLNNGELSVSWTAASGGVDDGGYLVLRKSSSASTGTPNVNGIYATGNSIGDGTVAYVGTSTSFTDTGLLTDGTSYLYTVFTFDKAYNYSSGVSTSGNQPLPVELTSFTGAAADNSVVLNWATATEVNNYGFNVERASTSLGMTWEKIAFVQGHGNSNSPKSYTFTDANAPAGNVSYRLKQIDFDGKFEYSDVVKVSVASPVSFSVKQNFPNPFNPATTIKYELPASNYVTVKVFDIIGREIETLVNKNETAGTHSVNFNAKSLPSGMYIYKVQAGSYSQIKKMLLIK